MSDVERWSVKPLGEHPCTCEKRIDGVFVRYAHYSELEAERDRLAAENERLREWQTEAAMLLWTVEPIKAVAKIYNISMFEWRERQQQLLATTEGPP